MELLDIIDEKDRVIGQAPRDKVHRKGLLHREVHVWFYTPGGQLIWQLRSKHKETFPGLLDATVGGHVSAGDDYLASALRETAEETGLNLSPGDLKLIATVRKDVIDEYTGLRNRTIRRVYAYRFNGNIKDLRVEPKEADGFELWSLQRLQHLPEEERRRFILNLLDHGELEMYKLITQLSGAA